MKIEELQDIPEQQYSLYLKDHKAEGVSYGADMPRDAEYRFQTEKNNIPKSQFFGKVRSLTGRDKETTYTTGALRAIPRFAIDASTGVVSGISRIGQEAFIQPALNIYDMYGWYSLDREVEDYKKSVGFYNMTPQEMGNFIKNDAKYLEIQQRMNQKSREIATREDPKFAQATNELWQNYRKAISNFEDAIGVSAKETDSEFINNIGSGAASLLEAAAIVAITKNPTAAAYVFGVQQGTGLYEEAREKGVDVSKAMALATAGGAAEGLLEKWGLHKLAENITTKTLFRAAGKSFLTESIQEGSQQVAEEALMYKIRNDEGFKDKAARVVESMAIGGMLGSVGSVVSRPFVLKYAKGIKEELTNYDVSEEEANNLVEKAVYGNEQEREQASHDIQATIGTARFSQMGFSVEEAQTLAEKFSITNQEFKDEIVESLTAELDPATYEGGTVEGGVKFFDENINKGVFTEDFDIAEDVKRTAEDGGMNEQQANLVATAVDSFAKVMYNKTGITPRENWENGYLSLMIKDERPSVEELEDVDENILTKEEAEAIDDGSYIGEDGQLYDKDGKLLFQGGLDLSQRINEIDAEEQSKGVPEYTAPTININGVERQTTNSAGNPIAKSEKSLRYFYDWFGDSKIVDKQGRPLVVYHGTNAEFDTFKGSAFNFTRDRGVAQTYGNKIVAAYLKSNNNIEIDFDGRSAVYFLGKLMNPQEIIDKIIEIKSDIDNHYNIDDEVMEELKNLGFEEFSPDSLDGIVFKNVIDNFGLGGKSSENYVVFNPNQIKSTSNRGTYSESENIYYQFIGPSAEGIDEGRLGKAISMLAEGKSSEEIRQATGWFYSKDQKLRYEISDKNAKVIKDGVGKLNRDGVVLLKELLDDKELYKSYPSIAETPVYMQDIGRANGLFDGKHIVLSNRLYENKSIRSVLKHEIQHIIQKIEGFARGGNTEQFSELSELNDEIARTKESLNKSNEYLERAEDLGYTDETIVDSESGWTVRDYKEQKEIDEKKIKELQDEIDNYEDPYSKYKRLLGEVEARDVQERLDMTERQRLDWKNKPATSSIINPIVILQDGTVIEKSAEEPRGFYKHSLNKKILEILKSGDASTVIHELGHYFTINYLEALQKTGQQEEAREILDWLGIASVDELLGDTQAATNALERLARGFETYVMTNEAPTLRLREFFERFKNWLLDIYNAIVPEQINDNVRNFFDKMLSAEEVDVSEVMRLAESKQDVREVIKQALSGKAVEIGGIKIDDIKTLVKTANARIPKKVKTLLERLKDVGINEKFAREFDLQNILGIGDLIADDEKLKELKKRGLITQKKINDARKLIRKVGGIEREDELIDFLHGLGLIRGSSETYEDTSALWDEAMNILENAESTYAMDDIEKAEARQAVMDAISQAEDMLAGIDYDSVIKALKTLAKEYTVGVKKETLKYIKDKQKEIEKGYMKLLKQMLKAQKKDMQDVRDAVVDYIKEQPILAEDKAKLIGFIKKANSLNTLQKLSDQIRNKAMEYYDKEQRKELNRAIQKELKQTKPYSGGEQRYDYENNKLFKDLRDYNKLTREKAGEELAKLPMDEASVEDLTETDLIKRRFLSYKANGADASTELLNQVLKDIVDAKAKGKQAKTDEEYEKAINMENDRQELIQILDESKADPKSVSQIIQNKYRTWITNLYSLLNSIFGKKVADKYQLETKQTDVNARVWKKTTDVINGIARILGVKGRAGVIDAFSDMAQRKYIITDVEGLNKEIDIFGVIDIYNAIKNEKTKQDYYNAFGELQVNSLVNTLTIQERALGDYMMQEVNNYYEKLNDVYVKLYGIDLPRVDNYWPATSEHKDSIDIQGDYFQQTTVPSALKERSRGRVIPIPANAWQKFNKHIAEAEYISGLGLDYMNIKKIFKSRRIKSKIIEKYGEPVYKAIMSDIESLSMASKIQEIDEVNNTFQKILGNTVLAKIAIGIPVFMKQLTSITNYAVDMPVKLWAKGFAEGLSHPKETVKYMMENAPFLKARLGQGYNEALARVIRDASKMSGKKVMWTEAMSSFTRYGDIGAIIFGGYPYMKYLKNTGVENASEKFEFATLRSQQSGTPVSLSPFQRSRGMMQIFQAFNNTPMQYMRMIYDAIYQWKNGDITAQQMCKQLFNFGIIQPVLYVLAGIYANKMLSWGDDDDDDNTIAQIVKQIVLNPIDGIPVFSDFIGAIVDRLSGEKNFGMKPVLISDIDKAFSKLNKKELDVWDAAEIITPIVEGMTAAPIGRIERLLKKNFKD